VRSGCGRHGPDWTAEGDAEADDALAVGLAWAGRPIDMERELPLRLWIGRLATGELLLVVAGHHLAFDGWSFKLLYEDLDDAYRALVDGQNDDRRKPAQYWQAVETDRGRAARKRLQDNMWAPLLCRDYRAVRSLSARAGDVVGRAGHTVRRIDGGSEASMTRAAQRMRVTPYVLGVSAFLRALSAMLGDDEVIVGTASLGRLSGESAEAIDYFSNSVFVGAGDLPRRSVCELIGAMNGIVARWLCSPRIQWEELLRAHHGLDLFAVKFSCGAEAATEADLRLPHVQVTRLTTGGDEWAKRPLEVNVIRRSASMEVRCRYRRDVLDSRRSCTFVASGGASG
jgi:hypothetical protein